MVKAEFYSNAVGVVWLLYNRNSDRRLVLGACCDCSIPQSLLYGCKCRIVDACSTGFQSCFLHIGVICSCDFKKTD